MIETVRKPAAITYILSVTNLTIHYYTFKVFRPIFLTKKTS